MLLQVYLGLVSVPQELDSPHDMVYDNDGSSEIHVFMVEIKFAFEGIVSYLLI